MQVPLALKPSLVFAEAKTCACSKPERVFVSFSSGFLLVSSLKSLKTLLLRRRCSLCPLLFASTSAWCLLIAMLLLIWLIKAKVIPSVDRYCYLPVSTARGTKPRFNGRFGRAEQELADLQQQSIIS